MERRRGISKYRVKKGVVTTMLLSTIALQGAPIIQVGAETVEYNHDGVEIYKTSEGVYEIKVSPMSELSTQDLVNPRAGQFTIKQIEQYNSTGETVKVDGEEVRLNLKGELDNKFILESDGTYTIQNTGRIPGFFIDSNTYQYTFPLIEDGKESKLQEVDFQPKVTPIIGDIEFKNEDEKGNAMEGVNFKLYQTYDAITGEGNKIDTEPVKLVSLVNIHIEDVEEDEYEGIEIANLTTGKDGIVRFTDLKEGQYYIQEQSTLGGMAQNKNRVMFEVTADSTGKELVVREIGDNKLEDGYIFKSFYRTTFENKINTSYTDKREDGEIIVSTNGKVNHTTDIKVPKDIGRYDSYRLTKEIPSTLQLIEDTIKVIGLDKGEEKDLTSYITVENRSDGVSVVQLNAGKGTGLQEELVGVEDLKVTYTTKVNREQVKTEDVLTVVNKIRWDNSVGDIGTIEQDTSVTVKEGALGVINKEESGSFIKGTEFTLYEEGTGNNEITYKGKTYIPVVNPRTEEYYKGVTNGEGRIIFDSIPYGNYILVETKASEGYLNNNEIVKITIEDTEEPSIEGILNSKIVEIIGIKEEDATVIDKITSSGIFGSSDKGNGKSSRERFQQTGSSIMWGSIIGGLSATILGAYILDKNRREEEL